MTRFRSAILRLIVAIAFLGLLWWLVARWSRLPGLGQVLDTATTLFVDDDRLARSILASSARWALGLVVGVASGLLIGMLCFLSHSRSRIYSTCGLSIVDIMAFLRVVPIIGLPAVVISVAGLSESGKTFIISWGAAFPVWLSTYSSLIGQDEEHLRFARAAGWTQIKRLMRVTMPSMAHNVFVGIRLAAGVAWLCVVAAELIGIVERGWLGFGLGAELWAAMNLDRPAHAVVYMACFGILGVLTDLLFRLLERQMFVYAFRERRAGA